MNWDVLEGVSFGIVRHCRTSDFVPDLSFPWSDNDGGSFWFSYLKKLSKSKSGREFKKQSVADFDTIMPCNHQKADSIVPWYREEDSLDSTAGIP